MRSPEVWGGLSQVQLRSVSPPDELELHQPTVMTSQRSIFGATTGGAPTGQPYSQQRVSPSLAAQYRDKSGCSPILSSYKTSNRYT